MDYFQPLIIAISQSIIIAASLWYAILEATRELTEHEQKLHSQYLAQRERHHVERLETTPQQPETQTITQFYDDSDIRATLNEIQASIKAIDREVTYAVQKAEEGADLAQRRMKSASTKEQRAEELLGLREQIKSSILAQTVEQVQPLPVSGKRIPKKI
jgi:hypothetical protein